MKKVTILFNLVLLTCLVSMTDCSQQGLTDPDDGHTAQTLRIQIKDAGYMPKSKQKGSLGIHHDKLTTTFTENDEIGLYAVRNGSFISGIKNLKLIAKKDNESESLVWETQDGENPAYFEDAHYFAYYPYQSTIDEPDPSASDASSFFASLISTWNPNTKLQTDEKSFSACDLMVASATPTGHTLNFQMEHTMGLLLFESPLITYKFTNRTKIGDYLVNPELGFDISDDEGSLSTKFQNYFVVDNTNKKTYYRLIKPGSNVDYAISIPISSTKTECKPAQDMKAGQYDTYNFIDKSNLTINFQMKPGDFYLEDGSLLSRDYRSFENLGEDRVTAIVVKAGRDANGTQYEDPCTYKFSDSKPMTIVHGYAIRCADQTQDYAFGSPGTGVGNVQAGQDKKAVGFYGYDYRSHIIDKNNQMGGKLETNFPACANINSIEKINNASDWFTPSIAQMSYIYNYKDIINASILKSKASGAKQLQAKTYGSSSEINANTYWGINFTNGTIVSIKKEDAAGLRAMMAF